MTKETKEVYRSIKEAIDRDESTFNFDKGKIESMRKFFVEKMTRNYARGSPHWGVHKELCKSEKIIVAADESDECQLTIWLTRPKSLACQPGQAPAIVYAHPGGGILGNAELFLPEACWIAVECNCFVFSVDYRKCPEHSFLDS